MMGARSGLACEYAAAMGAEIYFSIVQRKALTPNHFSGLDEGRPERRCHRYRREPPAGTGRSEAGRAQDAAVSSEGPTAAYRRRRPTAPSRRSAGRSRIEGAAWKNDWNLVFTREDGRPVSRQHALRFVLRPLLKKVGLPTTLRFHDLRHIAASLALGQGMPVPAVSEMLGHADAAIALRVYVHAVPGVQREVAQAMQAILAG